MKKKISLVIGFVLLLILSFTGCARKTVKTVYDQEVMQTCADTLLQSFNSMSGEDLDKFEKMSELQLGMTLLQSRLPIQADEFISMIEAWKAGVKECGKLKSVGRYKVETSNSGAVLSTKATFEKRKGDVSFSFDRKMNLNSITISAHYSTAEILEKAGLNTVLGMGTVFVVLIFISFIISLFKFIPAIERKFLKNTEVQAKSALAESEEVDMVSDTARIPGQDKDNNSELAAVIGAAIAAAEGRSADGFIVRSVKRRKTNKWS